MKNKIWNLSEEIKNDEGSCFDSISKTIIQLLYNRNIRTKEEVEYFLNADYDKNNTDPFLFFDMEGAVHLLIEHIKNKSKITVYGDYDADGVTSSVLLVDTLKLLHAEVDYYIPDRVNEGYGLNNKAIDLIIEGGSKLVITVDTGIRNKDEVKRMLDAGLEVILTDHHQAPKDKKDYPDCLIINPALPREEKIDTPLAGVGVALKLIQALVSRSKLDNQMKERLMSQFFDLAAIGTIADCVPLLKDNRLIAKKGLLELGKTKRIGIKELMKVSAIKNMDFIDSWNVGFQLAPRINAAGRMKHANTAFELLLSKDKSEAKKLASELNYNNQMRQKSTEKIVESVEEKLVGKTTESLLASVYEYEEGEEHNPWNEGIIGLVAGRITEKYYRPCLIITKTDVGYKGSGRSIPEFNLVKALEKASKYLDKYGGHPQACGFSLSAKKLDAFLQKIKEIAEKEIGEQKLVPSINIDMLLDFEDIDMSLALDIKKLCPFGQGNPQPIFLSNNIQVVDKVNMGIESQHLKLRLKNGSSNVLSAIGFSQSEKWGHINIGDKIDIVYNIDVNEFNGRRDVQLKIIDIKKNE